MQLQQELVHTLAKAGTEGTHVQVEELFIFDSLLSISSQSINKSNICAGQDVSQDARPCSLSSNDLVPMQATTTLDAHRFAITSTTSSSYHTAICVKDLLKAAVSVCNSSSSAQLYGPARSIKLQVLPLGSP